MKRRSVAHARPANRAIDAAGAADGGAGAVRSPTRMRPIRMILPFAPGGVTDVSARYVAQLMSVSLGQNRSSSRTAPAAAARSEPPPRRGRSPTAIRSWSRARRRTQSCRRCSNKLDYDPIKSFAPIAGMSNAPYLLVVNAERAGEERQGARRLRQGQCRQVQFRGGGLERRHIFWRMSSRS